MTTSITHYKPHNASRSGSLEHRFIASGAGVKTIAEWLNKDNERHGEWMMDKRALELLLNTSPALHSAQLLRFKFEIRESATDAAAAQRTRDHITLMKLSRAGALEVNWNNE